MAASVRKRVKQKSTGKAIQRQKAGKKVSNVGRQAASNYNKRKKMDKILNY